MEVWFVLYAIKITKQKHPVLQGRFTEFGNRTLGADERT